MGASEDIDFPLISGSVHKSVFLEVNTGYSIINSYLAGVNNVCLRVSAGQSFNMESDSIGDANIFIIFQTPTFNHMDSGSISAVCHVNGAAIDQKGTVARDETGHVFGVGCDIRIIGEFC